VKLFISVEVDMDTIDKDAAAETMESIARGIHELVAAQFMGGGEDLYGYEGPFATQIRTTNIPFDERLQ
jgi:hypothetical protein